MTYDNNAFPHASHLTTLHLLTARKSIQSLNSKLNSRLHIFRFINVSFFISSHLIILLFPVPFIRLRQLAFLNIIRLTPTWVGWLVGWSFQQPDLTSWAVFVFRIDQYCNKQCNHSTADRWTTLDSWPLTIDLSLERAASLWFDIITS